MWTGLSRALVVAAVLAVGATGCGAAVDAQKEDKAKIEKSISDGLAKDGFTLKSVTCPLDAPTDKADATWNCDAVDEQGTAGKIKVTKKGTSLDFEAVEMLVDLGGAGTQAEKLLTEQGGKPVTVKCPKKKYFAKKDLKFTCDATNDGAATKLEVTLTDDTGKVSFKLLGADKPADAKPEDAKPADDKPADDKHE